MQLFKILFMLFIAFFSNLLLSKTFSRVSGNGALSPNEKWFIDVYSVVLETRGKGTCYAKIEIVNLPINKFTICLNSNGKKCFMYGSSEREISQPDVILYFKESPFGRKSQIVWSVDSESVSVFSKVGDKWAIFYYNLKRGDFYIKHISSKEYSKMRKSFINLPYMSGYFLPVISKNADEGNKIPLSRDRMKEKQLKENEQR